MFTAFNLNQTLVSLGLSEDPVLFEKLRGFYSEPTRHYHDTTHVAECLGSLSRHKFMATNSGAIELAIWFHDAIYDTKKDDNEEQSAALAEAYLSQTGATSSLILSVTDMVLATKSHLPTNDDCRLMLDIDLGILGTEPIVFEAYDVAIRREYHWVSEETYRSARSNILEGFLDRERIYQTEPFSKCLEEQARKNIRKKIDLLRTT